MASAAGLALALLIAVPAIAGRGVAACGKPPCTSETKFTIPSPDGTAEATSPTLVKAVHSAIVEIGATKEDKSLFDDLTAALTALPNKHTRVLACVFISSGARSWPSIHGGTTFADDDLQALFLRSCLHLALQIQSKPAPKAVDTTGTRRCSEARVAIAVQITHTGSRYRLHAHGMTYTPHKRSPELVSCHQRSTGIAIGLRPRRRGTPLQRVVGRRIAIGFLNSASEPVRLTTTFRTSAH